MIALAAAMQPEIEMIKGAVEAPGIIKWNDFEFLKGRLCGQDVVAVHTGVGKVFSALVTQKLIDTFTPSALIFSGIGGSLNPELHRGDIVIGKDAVQHDLDATMFGFERGQVPYTDYRIIQSDKKLMDIALGYEDEKLKNRKNPHGRSVFFKRRGSGVRIPD